jgi:PAP2 superfamily
VCSFCFNFRLIFSKPIGFRITPGYSSVMRPRCWNSLCIIVLTVFQNSFAQESQSIPSSRGVVTTAKQFLQDNRDLWTSPLRVKRENLRWIVPLGIGTAALLKTDPSISAEIEEAKGIQPPSRIVSRAGSFPLFLAPAVLMAVGRVADDERTVRAGSVTLQAVLHSEIIVQALKAATNRERPSKSNGNGGFWDGGKSFPSGHAISSWAFAAAISDQYADKKWIGISSYAMATAVSLSRIGGQNHFPSDVLIGSSMGWLIGHYISHRHKQ